MSNCNVNHTVPHYEHDGNNIRSNTYIPKTTMNSQYRKQVDSSLSENQALISYATVITNIITYTMTSKKVK